MSLMPSHSQISSITCRCFSISYSISLRGVYEAVANSLWTAKSDRKLYKSIVLQAEAHPSQGFRDLRPTPPARRLRQTIRVINCLLFLMAYHLHADVEPSPYSSSSYSSRHALFHLSSITLSVWGHTYLCRPTLLSSQAWWEPSVGSSLQ